MIAEFFLSVSRLALPLMLAAIGGLLSERAGVAQLGLEGMMLLGALTASVTALLTGSTWLALSAAMGAGVALALIQALFVLRFRSDQIIVGTALNLFVFGLAPFITKILFDTTGSPPPLAPEKMMGLEFYALAAVLIGLVLYLYYRSIWGLRLRFAGEAPEVLVSEGLSDVRIRLGALAACGLLTGLGGASLTLLISASYSPMMSAGRGFMALAAVIFGAWRPVPTLLACLFFALIDAAQIRLQGAVDVPVQFIQILPYVVTIVALAGFYQRHSTPKGMGRHG
ncbi:MAG: ABC transporter permease [Bdellovibrionaceae bacterium]|nr:ABC transporter permease [Pseudobdellovibrionaceae bacterium]